MIAFAAPLLLLGALQGGGRQPREAPWWSQPLLRPEVPTVVGDDWARNPIDAFVLARLHASGLTPSEEAEPAVLHRRAHLVLGGLAPVDPWSGQSHEEQVDELLASLAFAEHQARHWLDLARFSETHGFEMNQPREGAWRYRDWVVEAFRADMPYGAFLGRQVAGDVLGDDAGTGFLVAGAWDEVKSPDPVLTAEQRQAELADMVNAVSTGFLGLTVACARCHDHKFDPLSQREYFAMEALLSGVQHGVRPLREPGDDERRAELEALLRGTRAELEELVADAPVELRSAVQARGNEERFAPVLADRVRFTILATVGPGEPCLDELEVFSGLENLARGLQASTSGDYAGNPRHRREHLTDGRYGNDHSWISNEAGSGWVELELAEARPLDRVTWARDREGVFSDRLARDYRVEVRLGDGPWIEVASGADRLPPGEGALLARARTLAAGAGREQAELLLQRHEDAEAELAVLEQRPRAYAGRFEEPSPTRLLYRGEVTQPREEVAPGLPAILGDLQLAPDASEVTRRAALAAWLAAPSNPLVPRVLVNRLWAWHFGTGLVATTSDFGVMGAAPSHPELLDWLACELVAAGGSLRHVHRLIATSATWRQRSRPRASAAALDAEARLLWRFPARRVAAEVLRDSLLAVTGTLDRTPGGPGFSAFEPNDNYVRNYEPLDHYGPLGLRRLLYMTQVRMEREGTFGSFDAPDGGQVCPERGRSTTPIQALALLNSPFVLEQAAALAQRIRAEHPSEPRSQVADGFRRVLGREPGEADLAAALELTATDGLEALIRALFNSNEFLLIP
ncbi:MAG: DUF1553 domain-containing protein [Planctomycetes bacterium]|nr:DUF1553 domain-containing protein [Planctomycetota bacterium]